MQKQCIVASDVIDGRHRGKMPPWQSKCENQTATLSYISILVFVWFSVGCCFFAFFGLFSGDLKLLHSYLHPDSPSFLKFFFRVLASGPFLS